MSENNAQYCNSLRCGGKGERKEFSAHGVLSDSILQAAVAGAGLHNNRLCALPLFQETKRLTCSFDRGRRDTESLAADCPNAILE